jgi:hypothetical protein
MLFHKKYLKYKNKYETLKKQIGGSSKQIIETNSKSDILKYIGAGVPNLVYYDSKLKVIIKILKNGEDRAFFIDYNKNILENTTILSSDESIIQYLTIKKSTLEDARTDFNFNMIKNYIEASKIINKLPTFLKFKGIIVYNNIGIKRFNGHIETPLIVPSFEYLYDIREKIDVSLHFKNEMKEIISDFKKYNSLGYYHGDLQKSCRNIVSYSDKEIRKLKVIDLDNPIKFITDKCDLNTLINVLLRDYISLKKCLVNLGFLSTADNIDINYDLRAFILSLELDITIQDLTMYSKTDKYPEYKLTLIGHWALQSSDGSLEPPSGLIDIYPTQTTSHPEYIKYPNLYLKKKFSSYSSDHLIEYVKPLPRLDSINMYYKITGVYDTNKSIDILFNCSFNLEENFQNIIKVENKNCETCISYINLLINRDKIEDFIRLIYEKLIIKISK